MIGYIVNEYPKISHTFIRREILALERLGVSVGRYAFRGWNAAVVEAVDETERDRTTYLLRGGALPLIRAFLRQFLRSPTTSWAALGELGRLMRRSDRSAFLHLITFLQACRFCEEIRRAGVTHIHAHFGTNSAECAMIASVLSGIPYSFTAHGPDEFDKPEFSGLSRKIALAKFVVGVSSFGKGQLQRWADPRDFDKIKEVHCGLDEPMFAEVPASGEIGRNFVCVARLSRQKGHIVLIRAFARLVQEGIDAHLSLIGDGDMRPAIEKLLRDEGIESRVTLLGWADEITVRRELLRSRALILTSYAEGLPVVFMEAMALGRVVLASNVAGNAELIDHGKTGWLFPAGSTDAATNVLRQCIMASDAQIDEMGRAGRVRVRERHFQADQAGILKSLFEDNTIEPTLGVRV